MAKGRKPRDGGKHELSVPKVSGYPTQDVYEQSRRKFADEAPLEGISDYDFGQPYDEAVGPPSMTRRAGFVPEHPVMDDGSVVPAGFHVDPEDPYEGYADPAEVFTPEVIREMQQRYPDRRHDTRRRPINPRTQMGRRPLP